MPRHIFCLRYGFLHSFRKKLLSSKYVQPYTILIKQFAEANVITPPVVIDRPVDLPMLCKLQEFGFGKVHKGLYFFWCPFEIIDRERVDGHASYTQSKTHFQYL